MTSVCVVMDEGPQFIKLASEPQWLYLLAVDKMEPYESTPENGLKRPKGYCFQRRRMNVTNGGMTDRVTIYCEWFHLDFALAWLKRALA